MFLLLLLAFALQAGLTLGRVQGPVLVQALPFGLAALYFTMHPHLRTHAPFVLLAAVGSMLLLLALSGRLQVSGLEEELD